MHYFVKPFTELTALEFFEIVKERVAVFVVEQNCPYQEVDDIDPKAIHTYLKAENRTIVAYTRIYQENEMVHFGRVLVKEGFRELGLGRKIVEETLAVIEKEFPNQKIVIGAQAHLQAFYASVGFKVISEVYLEDDIPHIDMAIG